MRSATFGMFHLVHSMILNGFFPVREIPAEGGLPEPELYREVLVRYWWFVPLALLAERGGELNPGRRDVVFDF